LPELIDTIRECQRGNALAWEALIRTHQARVYAVALHYLRHAEEAEDATQEVFLRVYRTLDRFRGEEGAFVPWLMAIARNCSIDRLRQGTARRRHEDPGQDVEMAVDDASGPEESTSGAERRRLVHQALARFNPLNREILMFREIQGMKLEDVAEMLALPVGTVKSRANRARIRLAKILAGRADPDDEEVELS